MKSIPLKQRVHTIFYNKAPLEEVKAKNMHERHQIDLGDFSERPAVQAGKIYKYVLSVLDVFSRYLWLRPLMNRSSKEVAAELKNLVGSEGPPLFIQCDKGTEFKGKVSKECKRLGIQVIRRGAHHPESQGKIEISHKGWKNRLVYGSVHNKFSDWVAQLPYYQMMRNEFTPFEIYHMQDLQTE